LSEFKSFGRPLLERVLACFEKGRGVAKKVVVCDLKKALACDLKKAKVYDIIAVMRKMQ
jgi:hypothetical protein